jgi:hypothetical protein
MPKRRTEKAKIQGDRKKGQKPTGQSKYALKGRFTTNTHKSSRPLPFQTTKRGRVVDSPKTTSLGHGIQLIATVCHTDLEKRGFVILKNDSYPKIYLSDGVLNQYDMNFDITVGDEIDCEIFMGDRGPRVSRIRHIKQLA